MVLQSGHVDTDCKYGMMCEGPPISQATPAISVTCDQARSGCSQVTFSNSGNLLGGITIDDTKAIRLAFAAAVKAVQVAQ